jgi:ABC-type antimicrobial peptide transport system permease subunit
MFKNYFKIAVRNIVKHKAYAAINITGLAVGIAACVLLFTVVRYELSYDKFQTNYNRIYRIVTKDDYADGVDYTPGVPFPALEAVRTTFPQFTTGALFANFGSQVTVVGTNSTAGKKFIEETGFFFAEPQFFRVFHYEWLSGSPAVLNQPNVTVLTQKMAEKYFGSWKNAIGGLLKLDNAATVKVAGILKNPLSVQRTKEIGIRKVLGASVQNIIYLFSKEFTVLIIIGFLIAAPLAYYMMNTWLQNFQFHVNISVGIFIIAILVSIIIAWITVGYKSMKAALRNPVDSLKTE